MGDALTGELHRNGPSWTAARSVSRRRALDAAPASALAAAIDGFREAVVICAADHTVRYANAAAHRLAPALDIGGYLTDTDLPGLAQAIRAGTDRFVDDSQGRRVAGHRRALPDGYVAWHLRTPADEQPTPTRAEQRAQALLAEAGQRLPGALTPRRCLQAVAELSVAYLADAVVVAGPPEHPHTGWVRLIAGGRVEECRPLTPAITAMPELAEALASYPPIPSRRLDPTTVPAWLVPDSFGPVGELLLVPAPGNAVPGGALLLARRADRERFSDADEALARTFAARAGTALAAASLYREQAEAIAVLQADLLPPRLPQLPGVELVGSYQPAEHGLLVGGDFYDVFPSTGAGAQTGVVLGDVCGKGAQAAALTGRVRQTLRAMHLVEQHPAKLLSVLNEALLQQDRDGRFVTLVVGALTQTHHGQVRLTFATGGHPAPLVLRRTGTVVEVPATGTLIGVLPDPQFQTAAVELAPGDLCLLYSDGMIEGRGGATGNEQYGDQRLRQALASCHGMPADAAVERLRQLVSDWIRGDIQDDIAMLAIRARTHGRR